MQHFEPDQLVLVRLSSIKVWRLRRYSFCDGPNHETQDGNFWDDGQILPYEGNENLLGTMDWPTPKWEPKPGELVAVRDSENEGWKARVFLRRDNGIFECGSEIDLAITTRWKFCEPLRKHFNVPD